MDDKQAKKIVKTFSKELDNINSELIEIVLEALKKQTPKEVKRHGIYKDGTFYSWMKKNSGVCPVCKARIEYVNLSPSYCSACGQRLDWRKEEDV